MTVGKYLILSVLLIISFTSSATTPPPSASTVEGKEVQVGFTISDGFLADFSIDSVKAKRVGDELEFTVSYALSNARGFSFFSPPNGKILMYENRFPDKSTEYKFSILVEDVKKCENITMKFQPWDAQSFIFLNMYDLKRVTR